MVRFFLAFKVVHLSVIQHSTIETTVFFFIRIRTISQIFVPYLSHGTQK